VTPEELKTALAVGLAPILRRLGKQEPRLLSKRAAARRLGVDRGTTLTRLIHSGQIRTLTVAGRVKIPASEIERIEAGPSANGSTAGPSDGQRRAATEVRAARGPQKNPGRAIRALKIG